MIAIWRRDTFGKGIGLFAATALFAEMAIVASTAPGVAAQADPVGTPSPVAPVAVVNVNGQGRVTAPPDTASVTVGVDVTEATLDAAQAEATRQATAIIDAARSQDIAEDDIQTVNFSVTILREYDNEGNPGEIQGYQVSNQVNVIMRDIDAVGDVLDAVVAAGANNIYGISFYIEDTTAAASQARIAAVDDARTKADELAAAAGMSVGRVLSISESYAPGPMPQVFESAAGDMAAGRAAAPIQPGTTEVYVDVQMSFELV